MMHNTPNMNKTFLNDKYFLKSLLVSILLFVLSLVFFNLTDLYTNRHSGNPVSDIVLDNVPLINLYGIYIYGPILIWIILLIVCFAKPHSFPFVLKSLSLLILVRSVFTCITHIGPPNHEVVTGQSALFSIIIKQIDFSGDLFFSGHTGCPFLMGLIFWPYLRLRVIFISASILFGIVVLACHVHYSIDVLAAFFISHSVYHISKKLFARDYDYFVQGTQGD